jgi:hypothetical protein
MRTVTKLIIFIFVGFLFVCTGCEEFTLEPNKADLREPQGQQLQQKQLTSNRFQEPTDNQLLAVKEKKDLSEKFTKLTEDFEELQKKNEEMTAVNKALSDELGKYKGDHDQAKKELKEANDLLVEMRIELNNWKRDILGFREEMRNADIAQLEALFKVLKILGADLGAAPEEASLEEATN